jgi:hypothetical protein
VTDVVAVAVLSSVVLSPSVNPGLVAVWGNTGYDAIAENRISC